MLHGTRAVLRAAASGTDASPVHLGFLFTTSRLITLILGPKYLLCFSQLQVGIFLDCEHLKAGLCALGQRTKRAKLLSSSLALPSYTTNEYLVTMLLDESGALKFGMLFGRGISQICHMR